MSQVHSSYYRPQIYPYESTEVVANIDRAQSIDPSEATNWVKVEEIGRDGKVGDLKKVPTIGYSLSQLEYGNFDFWRKITNQEDAILTITHADFKTSTFDIAAFLTDDAGAFVGTQLYPELRVAGFSINIPNTTDMVERKFDFVGEKAVTWQGANKYFVSGNSTVPSGETTNYEINLTSLVPAADPDDATYMFRVVRVSGGVTTTLALTTDFTYSNSTKILTILSVTSGDVIKYYVTSAVAPASIFPLNDSDVAGILADSVDIYLYVPGSGHPAAADKVYRLQSATVDVKFDREDVREIGNRSVVQRGIKDTTVTVTLGEIVTGDWSIEEVLRGVVTGYGKIDIDELTDDATIIIKIYTTNAKTTFKYGFLASGLAPRDLKPGASINAYVKKDTTMEGETFTLTTDAGVLGI